MVYQVWMFRFPMERGIVERQPDADLDNQYNDGTCATLQGVLLK